MLISYGLLEQVKEKQKEGLHSKEKAFRNFFKGFKVLKVLKAERKSYEYGVHRLNLRSIPFRYLS